MSSLNEAIAQPVKFRVETSEDGRIRKVLLGDIDISSLIDRIVITGNVDSTHAILRIPDVFLTVDGYVSSSHLSRPQLQAIYDLEFGNNES